LWFQAQDKIAHDLVIGWLEPMLLFVVLQAGGVKKAQEN